MVDFSHVKDVTIPEGSVKSISSGATILWHKAGGGLPDIYQEVEYIQSDGSQYIDTGIVGNGIGEYKIKMNPLTRVRTWEQYFGGQLYTENEVGKLYENMNNFVYQGYPYARNQYATLGSVYDRIYEIEVTIANGIVSNGVVKSSYSGAKWGTLSFFIFKLFLASAAFSCSLNIIVALFELSYLLWFESICIVYISDL